MFVHDVRAFSVIQQPTVFARSIGGPYEGALAAMAEGDGESKGHDHDSAALELGRFMLHAFRDLERTAHQAFNGYAQAGQGRAVWCVV